MPVGSEVSETRGRGCCWRDNQFSNQCGHHLFIPERLEKVPVSRGRGWGENGAHLGRSREVSWCRAGRALGRGQESPAWPRPGRKCFSRPPQPPHHPLPAWAVERSPSSVLLSFKRNATLSSSPGLPRTEITSKKLLSWPKQMEALVFLQKTLVSA